MSYATRGGLCGGTSTNADVQRLLWIPGLGKVNAFTIYTEIDGITRFPSAGQFFSYS